MGKYFGTDGFRGEAGVVLTAEHAFRIGQVLGHYYKKEGSRPRAVIGKDTRRSSYMLEYAIAAGLASVGVKECALGLGDDVACVILRIQEYLDQYDVIVHEVLLETEATADELGRVLGPGHEVHDTGVP